MACSSPDRRDLKTYIPTVASDPLRPTPAATQPTDLSTISPSMPRGPETPFGGLDTERLLQKIVKDERSIFFDYNKSHVRPEYRLLIEGISNEVLRDGISEVRVEGNTDVRGSRAYNLALGQRRANVVRKALADLGVPHNSIKTISYGKERILAPGDDEESHAINRRSDVLYSGEY